LKPFYDIPQDAESQRRRKAERAKTRELRRTPWWQEQLARGVCHHCLKQVGLRGLTLDHLVPIARGGKSVRSNVVPSCFACNQEKGLETPAERLLRELAATAHGNDPQIPASDLRSTEQDIS
jgi:5-methylcytosine-specific restriction protein A